jgi:hypothetical protein
VHQQGLGDSLQTADNEFLQENDDEQNENG